MYENEVNKMIWDYDIPQSIDYLVEIHDNCEICKNTDVKDWSAPFIAANVNYDQIIKAIEKMFGFITTPEIIANHRTHIKTNIVTDAEVKSSFKRQMELIESDTPKKIDEKVALESLIRGLYARKQFLEKTDQYGKEYIFNAQQLKQAIELKLKMKNELQEPSERATLHDIVKLFEIKRKIDESVKPTIVARKVWVRDGTKQSIEHFVRFENYGYKSGNRIDLPYPN
jgi:predicted house-cleaning noncanonical NTP pyrophosphatase (MazG superfamily)